MIPDFKNLENGEIVQIGYQRVNCHIIFDVNMEDFRRKARLVAGRHVTEPPATITYTSVVSKETVRINLTLAALNDFPVKVADIQNAYMTAPVIEKIWAVLGQEFGEDAGRKFIVVWAIYGLKSTGAAFWNHFKEYMQHLVFLTCPADLYLWMKPTVRPEDRFYYYAELLIYVDDVMVIHNDAESVLR